MGVILVLTIQLHDLERDYEGCNMMRLCRLWLIMSAVHLRHVSLRLACLPPVLQLSEECSLLVGFIMAIF